MTLEQIQADMVKINDLQKDFDILNYYKTLFLQVPEAFNKPHLSWKDFCLHYNTYAKSPIPSDEWDRVVMTPYLSEQDFFRIPEYPVALLCHPRYMPPHLHSHDFIKMVYILNGTCKLFLDKNHYCLEKGDFFIVSPNVEHAVFSCHDEDIAVNILMRSSTFSASFFSLLSDKSILSEFFWKMLYSRSSNKVLLFRCGEDERLSRNVLELYRECCYEAETSGLLLKSYVMLLLGILLQKHVHQIMPLQKVHEKYKHVSAWLRFMEENLSSVTLSALAARFRLSEAHISRLIHMETGYTFRSILQDMRLKRAAYMLKSSSLSIERIAETIGYTDAGRLYRNFKAAYNMTPASYRMEPDSHTK